MAGFFNPPRLIAVVALVALSGALVAHQTAAKSPFPLATARQPAAVRTLDKALAAAKAEGNRLIGRDHRGRRLSFTIDRAASARITEYFKNNELPYAAAVLIDLQSNTLRVVAGYSKASTSTARQLCFDRWAPAASLFKVITGAALLENGVRPDAQVCYRGGIRQLSARHLEPLAPAPGVRCATLSEGIAGSLNAVLAQLADRKLDQQKLQTYAERFGFNAPIPLALHVQPSTAIIPKDPLGRARVAAGFWKTETSALHAAVIASIVARDGLLRWPEVVEGGSAPPKGDA